MLATQSFRSPRGAELSQSIIKIYAFYALIGSTIIAQPLDRRISGQTSQDACRERTGGVTVDLGRGQKWCTKQHTPLIPAQANTPWTTPARTVEGIRYRKTRPTFRDSQPSHRACWLQVSARLAPLILNIGLYHRPRRFAFRTCPGSSYAGALQGKGGRRQYRA